MGNALLPINHRLLILRQPINTSSSEDGGVGRHQGQAELNFFRSTPKDTAHNPLTVVSSLITENEASARKLSRSPLPVGK